MVKRMLLMLLVLGAILTGLGFLKFQQIQEAIAQGAAFQPPPEAVTTIVAEQERWPQTLAVIGTIAPVQGVMVSADLPGIVDQIEFDSGKVVQEGDLLVTLDTRQEEAQLAAAEAERDLAKGNFARLEGLVEARAISRADYDQAQAEQKRTEARVGEIQATIARKVIRAPFSGVLGIRQVNRGQYLTPGDPVVSLQSLDPIYANFAVPQQHLNQVQVGRNVRITLGELAGAEFSGRVTAINSVVDETTRTIQVQATLANPRGRLQPGMFVDVDVLLGATTTVVALPASAISYAPYGDSVFVVTDLEGPDGQTYRGVRQQFVKLGPARGDLVAVLSGLNPGEEVVTSGVFKLRNGAAVFVNNEVQPSSQQAPTPEDS
jgi:membrane fusion protein (multidrug efflux system)